MMVANTPRRYYRPASGRGGFRAVWHVWKQDAPGNPNAVFGRCNTVHHIRGAAWAGGSLSAQMRHSGAESIGVLKRRFRVLKRRRA